MSLFDVRVATKIPDPPKIKVPICKINYDSELLYTKNLENLEEIGQLEQNTIIAFATKNFWSQYQLLEYILLQTGKANVYMATWSFGTGGVKALQKLAKEDLLDSLFIVYDFTTADKQADLYDQLKAICKNGKLKITNCHAKIVVIQNETWNLVVTGSANMTNNSRFEHGQIFTIP